MADPVVNHLLPVDNIRAAYHLLEERVVTALRTQLGDAARLANVRSQALSLLQTSQPRQHDFPPEEWATFQRSISNMVQQLDGACHASNDPPPSASLSVSTRVSSGRRGRPRIEISPSFLAEALTLRGPTRIAPALGCSPRTVRRRALEQGLVQPAPAVIRQEALPDGTVIRTHTPPVAAYTVVSDAQLDNIVSHTLEIFPRFGRAMLHGHLKACGYILPVKRVT
ncbi:hypothetical protein PHLGIDRAFT_80996, partial [Phlebiopsis gigantea 11061_1 CR5-6]